MKGEINFDINGLVQGNNKSILSITVTKKGSIENIEGATVRVAIKHDDFVYTKQAVITDAANGKCEVTLTREDLTGSGWYFYQPTITFPDDREYTGGIDRFNVSGKLSGPVPTPVPNGIDLNRLGINANGRLTIDGVEQIGGSGGGGTMPSNVILFEDWIDGESVTIDTGTTPPPADTTAPILTISPNGGNFASAQGVTMTTNETADIYYTLDGSTPTTASTKYTAALSLSATTTLKAFAMDTSGNSSAVQTITFTKDVSAPTDTTAPLLTMTAAATFTDTQTVTMSANETSDIWYTVDGSDPVASGTRVKYSAPVTLAATTTVKAYAVDTAGNASSVQTVVYTKQSTAGWVTDGLVQKWDNITNVITVSDSTLYFPPTGDFTVVVTFKPKAYATVIAQFDGGGNAAVDSINIAQSPTGTGINGTLYGEDGTFPTINTTAIMTDATLYYHAVFMRDSTGFKWYVNNTVNNSLEKNSAWALKDATQSVKIGTASCDYKNALYYNRALTSAELTQNYNALK